MRTRAVRADEFGAVTQVHENTARVAYAHIFPGQPFPREQTIERWRRFPGRMMVAVDGDAIVGFVAFDESELHALYVLPGYQGNGLGSRLLDAAGAVTRLWVLKENHAARRFYEARGWFVEGREQVSFGAVELLYRRQILS